MHSYVCSITAVSDQNEVIIAMLSELLPFEAFEEKEDQLEAYLEKGIRPAEIEEELQELARKWNFAYSWQALPDKNWNEAWEAAFQPVAVDDFCLVRADFHPGDPKKRYDIIINPKMAFGTGHHETTYLMIRMMSSFDLDGKKVLDYGCGTGILAILASKMGAQEVDAVDIEAAAFENTLENAQINNVFNVRAIHGDLEAVIEGQYDLILANINRSVILASLARLQQKLNKSGHLLISGILLQDEPLLEAALKKNKFTVVRRLEKGEWLCMKVLP